MRFARVKSDNICLLWPQRMLGYFWSVTSKIGRLFLVRDCYFWSVTSKVACLFLVRDWQSRVAGHEGQVTNPWLTFWCLSCVLMKRGDWPKIGTVGTSPGHVRDMSRTIATKNKSRFEFCSTRVSNTLIKSCQSTFWVFCTFVDIHYVQ